MRSSSPTPTPQSADDLTAHLQHLHAETAQTVADMEAINATSAAAAYYRIQRTCERFLTNPPAQDVHDEPHQS